MTSKTNNHTAGPAQLSEHLLHSSTSSHHKASGGGVSPLNQSGFSISTTDVDGTTMTRDNERQRTDSNDTVNSRGSGGGGSGSGSPTQIFRSGTTTTTTTATTSNTTMKKNNTNTEGSPAASHLSPHYRPGSAAQTTPSASPSRHTKRLNKTQQVLLKARVIGAMGPSAEAPNLSADDDYYVKLTLCQKDSSASGSSTCTSRTTTAPSSPVAGGPPGALPGTAAPASTPSPARKRTSTGTDVSPDPKVYSPIRPTPATGPVLAITTSGAPLRPVPHAEQLRTGFAPGPRPVFEKDVRHDYNFHVALGTAYVVLQLKARRTLASNLTVGTAVLNPAFLEQLRDMQQLEVWIPMKAPITPAAVAAAAAERAAGTYVPLPPSQRPEVAMVRVLLSVPELHKGVESTPEIAKVVGTSMRHRKLEVTVYGACLPRPNTHFVLGKEHIADDDSAALASHAPSLYAEIHTGAVMLPRCGGGSSAADSGTGTGNAGGGAQKEETPPSSGAASRTQSGVVSGHTVRVDAADTTHRTRVIKSFSPQWDERFELFSEVMKAKALTIRLMQRSAAGAIGGAIGLDTILGVLILPLGFYLNAHEQKMAAAREANSKSADKSELFGEKTEVWDTYTLVDPATRALTDYRIEVRLTIEQRRQSERAADFFRTESREPTKVSHHTGHSAGVSRTTSVGGTSIISAASRSPSPVSSPVGRRAPGPLNTEEENLYASS